MAAWNALAGSDNPFTRHAFLSALEDSHSIGHGTGWTPHHIVGDRGVLPLYLKDDSFGEFVFDWAWAEAWQRLGLRYYPKLVAATPYSPVSAPRFLGDERDALIDAAITEAKSLGVSTLHFLFLADDAATALAERGFLLRNDCQFHWRNRGYGDFDDFLATFRSSKRKDLRKERRKVADAGLEIRRHAGSTIDAALWARIHALTARSFQLRGNPPYLNARCFELLGERLGDQVQVFLAWDGESPVACALCFEGAGRLYGRYWGAQVDIPGLHFELCFYQGIEYCITKGLDAFEPGAQGEHKLARGFEPTRTTSAHWIAEPSLRVPVEAWCERERAMVEQYVEAAAHHLPFHRT